MMERPVRADEAGQRLDRIVQGAIEGISRAAAQDLVDGERVRVDGDVRGRSFRPRAGMTLTIDVPEAAPVPESDTTIEVPTPRIVHRDDRFVVVDKPAGLITHAAPGARGADLASLLAAESLAGGGESDRPGVVHRLDRDTSGLLVVAGDDDVRRALQGLLRRRRIEREYLALVHGRPASTTGRIEAPIGRDPRSRTRRAIDGIGARPATTWFSIREAFADHTLLDVRLETGRTHQIRVHLAAIGLPVVGDPVYGNPSADPLGLERQALHAHRLSFPHPSTGDPLEFRSPPPEDMMRAIERARAAEI